MHNFVLHLTLAILDAVELPMQWSTDGDINVTYSNPASTLRLQHSSRHVANDEQLAFNNRPFERRSSGNDL